MIVVDTSLASILLNTTSPRRYPGAHRFVDDLLRGGELSISFVTRYELERGVRQLVRQGEGRRKLVALKKLLDCVDTVGLDGPGGGGWSIAANIWAEARSLRPALVLSDADLLIAATAEYHARAFATSDARLAEGLSKLAISRQVRLIALE